VNGFARYAKRVGYTTALVGIMVSHFATRGVEQTLNLGLRFQSPSFEYPLGTDHLGRNVLLLTLSGAVPTVLLSLCTVFGSCLLGTGLGLLSVVQQRFRFVLVGVADVLLAIPTLVIALISAASLGPGSTSLLLVLVGVGWTPYFRLVRQCSLTVMALPYVEAAHASGASRWRVLRRHVLPNIASPLRALATIRVGHAIVAVSSLSYLGIGSQPPSSEWGAALAGAQPYAEQAPWAVIVPAFGIAIVTLIVSVFSRRNWRTAAP
jgi:peptide/nickel transport system permease protein